jgi:hypothetical protein
LNGIELPKLSEAQVMELTKPFCVEEIGVVIASSDENKNLGPDEFNFGFFKELWEEFKGEVNIMFAQFFDNSILPKVFHPYFIVFVLIVLNPHYLGDFHPISLVGVCTSWWQMFWLRE